ncbi:MAG: transglycosylase SLT domain-containing protein, partial [Gammaproteobacteria bacterium]|nr:transglycosylase SLT domain-containing protein [Gammaproteobacteria bacterium]
TAKHLGVDDRVDVEQSIRGGARYFLDLRKRLPDRIAEPDRTWMALAAYNVGLGHLEDARVLTERRGKDPDDWLHVREHLPLLSEERWYRETKHGYARGYEPVHYVRNVRRYYHVLLQLTQPQMPPQQLLVESPILELPLL